MTLNDLTVNAEGLDRDTVLSDWSWLIPNGGRPVLITAMGDVFVQDGGGAVHYLDTCSGTVAQIADDGSEFQELLKDAEFVTAHMYPSRIAELREAGLDLTPGQCYSYKTAMVLGGEDEVDNLEVTDISVHISIAGQVHQQVKDLPEGAEISNVEISDEAPDKPWWKIW